MSLTGKLFEALDVAFTRLDNRGQPSVVVSIDTLELSEFSQLFPQSWQVHRVSGSEVGSRVSDMMLSGPVLLLPAWESPARRRANDRYAFQDVLAIPPPTVPSVLAVVLPSIVLRSRSGVRFRQDLRAVWQILLVIEASDVLPFAHPGFAVSILFCTPISTKYSVLRMFHLNSATRDAPVQLSRLLSMEGGELADGYVVREALPLDVSLAYERHKPSLLERKSDLRHFGSVAPVGELFDVRAGLPLTNLGDQSQDQIPVLRGRDIRSDGTITLPDSPQTVAAEKNFWLHAGDLVMRSISLASDVSPIAVSEVSSRDLPLVASSTVLVLRPREGLSESQRRIAWHFFRSQLFKSLVHSLGSGGPRLDAQTIRSMYIPQPDAALVEALEQLEGAAATFELWHAEADAVLSETFDADDARSSRLKIVQAGRAYRLKAQAGLLVDNLDYTIRTRLPLPIAYRQRIVEAEMSNGPTHEAYTAILDLHETLICYAAVIGLLMARISDIELKSVRPIREKLASGRRGLGLGDWLSVLREVCLGRRLRALGDAAPFADVRVILGDDDADAASSRLTDRRNNEAHQRRVEAQDLPTAVRCAAADMQTLLGRALVLADFPLMYVRRARWDQFRNLTVATYSEMMGDHPIVPSKTIDVHDQPLEEESLYLLDGRMPHLLRPLIIGANCERCGHWSTFVLDKVQDMHPLYRSLEHGHQRQEPELVPALRQVGLLAPQTKAGPEICEKR